MQEAFDLADQYRIPVMMLLDGMIGQMMEPVEWTHTPASNLPEKTWATTGTQGKRPPNIINSLFIDPDECNRHNQRLAEKYKRITENEIKYSVSDLEEAEVLFVAYGTPSRLARAAARLLGEEGIKAGVFRPISVWPYPYEALHEAASRQSVQVVVTVEMSMGQMVDDVRIAVNGVKPVSFVGQAGGVIPSPREVADAAKEALGR
jgi:2-oxoglutarate ferredoxin oxidoreductase subunit alpha